MIMVPVTFRIVKQEKQYPIHNPTQGLKEHR